MKKQNFKIKIVLVTVLFSILTSCTSGGQKIEYYQLILEFDESIKDTSVGSALPSQLTALMEFYETFENDECFGYLFAPEIVYKRTDLDETFKFGTPLKSISSIQKSTKTLSPINLKEGYDISLLTVPKLLIKEDKEKKRIKRKQKLILNFNDDAKTIEKLKTKIKEMLCKKNARSITIIVNQNGDDSTGLDDTVTQLLEEADILFNNEDYKTAQSKYQEVLSIDKDNSVALERINSIKKTVTTTTKTTTTIEVGKKPVKPKTKTSKTTYKITNDGSSWSKKQNEYNSDYGKYEGGIENGKMHGQGTLVFYKSHSIPVPKHSSYKIMAVNGDKLSGRFKKGYFVTGVLYDKKGQKKKSILPGE